jgi:NitT/TauT family transport system permease protein
MSKTKRDGTFAYVHSMAALALLLLALAAWEVAGRRNAHFEFLLSRPTEILVALVAMARSGTLTDDIAATTYETLVGTTLGTVLGSALGLGLWLSRRAARLAAPFVAIASNFPVFALAPAAIVWLGIGLGMKIFLAAFATFFVSLRLAHSGAQSAHDTFSGVFDGFRASRWDTYTKIIIPGALDSVFNSMRVNVGLGLLGAFIGEFIASERGLGHAIIRASGLYQIDRVFAASLCIIVVATVFDLGARAIQARKRLIARLFGLPRSLRRRSAVLGRRYSAQRSPSAA